MITMRGSKLKAAMIVPEEDVVDVVILVVHLVSIVVWVPRVGCVE